MTKNSSLQSDDQQKMLSSESHASNSQNALIKFYDR